MQFPTADVLAAHMEFLNLTSIANDLTKHMEPLGLTAKVDFTQRSLTQYVGVPLPDGGNVFALTHRDGSWIVGGPPELGEPTVWPADTQSAELVQLLAHTAAKCVTGEPIPTPWRWGRTRPSPLTDLADALLALGLTEDEVVIPRPCTLEGSNIHRTPGRTDIVAVHFNDDTYEVTHNATTGWAVDYVHSDQVGSRRRLDLRRAVSGHSEPTPVIPEGLLDTEQLAALLHGQDPDAPSSPKAPALLAYASPPRAAGHNDWLTGAELKLHDEQQDARYAAAWLRWCGFTDAAHSGKKHNEVHAKHLTVHFHRANTPAGQAVLERALGKAVIQGNRAAVICRTWFTREATRLADAAGVALFTQDDGRVLHPQSTVASHLMPDPGELAPPQCDDRSCRANGCMLEDEYCSTERGRGWVDEDP
ncbi:hypothetical protein [Actinotalea solisilvae]|uniref:hypothetical protein n=1 Tax=Actinotalea solisilvae TaxID=2072922 RepID=UPI0018F169D8|nr:hypothetical protein [Actinotalea solisilvae]